LIVDSQLRLLSKLPSTFSESASALQEIQTTIQSGLSALTQAKISTENWDCLIVLFVAEKLQKLSRSLWEQSLANKREIPSWNDLNKSCERYQALEAMDDGEQPQNSSAARKLSSFETAVAPKGKTCDLCSKENHPVRVCPRFLQMTVQNRSN